MVDTILTDKNELALDMMEKLCSLSPEINLIGSFQSYGSALEFAKNRKINFALIDYPEDDEQAIAFGQELRRINGSVVLIYLITRPLQTFEALKIKADFCLIKPFSKGDFKDALRRACTLNTPHNLPTEFHMFGKFSVIHEGCAVDFKSSKAKELFALCADHCGTEVTMEEAADKLWGDRPYDDRVKALYRKAVMNIRRALEQYNIDDVFYVNRGSCGINPFNISCDYYKYRSAPQANYQLYNEGYLSDYSWAEEKAAMLFFQKKKFLHAE